MMKFNNRLKTWPILKVRERGSEKCGMQERKEPAKRKRSENGERDEKGRKRKGKTKKRKGIGREKEESESTQWNP